MGVTVTDLTGGYILWQDTDVTDGCDEGIHGPWALDSANTDGRLVSGHVYETACLMYLANGDVTASSVSPNETFVP